MAESPPADLVSLKEVSRRLERSYKTLRYWADKGWIRPYTVAGRNLYSVEEVRRFATEPRREQ